MSGSLFNFTDTADYERVRDVFRAAGYSDEGIVKLLGEQALTRFDAKRIPALLRRLSGGTPLEILIRIFILGVDEPLASARVAIAPMSPEHWAELGLLEYGSGTVRATVQIRNYGGLLVAWDFSQATRGALHPDYVMGISPSTLGIAGLTVRRENRSALDLGTGSGFLAFLAARHSKRVVATDKNARCVAMADFNARLNGLEVECLEGDLFEPVAGSKFDLIVSNPPFIISPDNIYYFLHSGLRGDEVCQKIARAAPDHLDEGGYCQFLANWALSKGEDWRERIAGWFEGSGSDVFVMLQEIKHSDDYAASWIETQEGETGAYAAYFDNWMRYYNELGIDSICSGMVAMRRRQGGNNWFWPAEAPATMAYPCGDDVERVFLAQDFLRSTSNEALLDMALAHCPGLHLEQHFEATEAGWSLEGAELRKLLGLQYVGGIDAHGAELIGACNGQRPVRELLTAFAADLGTDVQSVTPGALAVLRRLIEQGFLLPATA